MSKPLFPDYVNVSIVWLPHVTVIRPGGDEWIGHPPMAMYAKAAFAPDWDDRAIGFEVDRLAREVAEEFASEDYQQQIKDAARHSAKVGEPTPVE